MKRYFLLIYLIPVLASAQKLALDNGWKFKTGDKDKWGTVAWDDSKWQSIKPNTNWESQGNDGYDGYGWYRLHFVLPLKLKTESNGKRFVVFHLNKIDDADITYLNGNIIGNTGFLPDNPAGFLSAWDADRNYKISVDDPSIKWDVENILAIRVYDDSGSGGLYGGTPYLTFEN